MLGSTHPQRCAGWHLSGQTEQVVEVLGFSSLFLAKKIHISMLFWWFQLLKENPSRPLSLTPLKREFGP